MTATAPDPVSAAAEVLGDRARRQVALGPLTTYRVGGPADLFLVADEIEDLLAAAEAVAASGVPVLVVGRGSNLLVADAGFHGLAIVLGRRFGNIRISGTTVAAGAAVSLPVLARRTAAAGLHGFEWAVGVPGSVGGAVRMNAGGHGSEVSRVLIDVTVLDLARGREADEEVVPVSDLDLGYRRSRLTPTQVVLSARLGLQSGDRDRAEQLVSEIVRWRREHQPGGANAGSIFVNPEGDSAGRLIEVSGLKGHRRGSASVSAKHANFFQCDSAGSADDVKELIREVAEVVHRRTGVRLNTEVHLVGFAE